MRTGRGIGSQNVSSMLTPAWVREPAAIVEAALRPPVEWQARPVRLWSIRSACRRGGALLQTQAKVGADSYEAMDTSIDGFYCVSHVTNL
ncbi:hypothetical protein SAMN04489716_2374 [Actinoplanes derwentensis]|uniref:Uncharacterized protein n=1 Tax=Actinoplanes derwentensis TaxID=113562 RepID=A0A1H1X823_9ACTN|nr:hypothetical protein Ade03nite_46080 [Actinoplanes derwentensis]SDT05438.1 hypothetical protein SAMN04489716_2374 [Actinoplanes derwentensis]